MKRNPQGNSSPFTSPALIPTYSLFTLSLYFTLMQTTGLIDVESSSAIARMKAAITVEQTSPSLESTAVASRGRSQPPVHLPRTCHPLKPPEDELRTIAGQNCPSIIQNHHRPPLDSSSIIYELRRLREPSQSSYCITSTVSPSPLESRRCRRSPEITSSTAAIAQKSHEGAYAVFHQPLEPTLTSNSFIVQVHSRRTDATSSCGVSRSYQRRPTMPLSFAHQRCCHPMR